MPSTYNGSKPMTQDVIEDQSLMVASSNGFQNACDVEEDTNTEASISDNPQTTMCKENEFVCSRTNDGGKQENDSAIHEKNKMCKKSDMSNVSAKKKSSIGRDSNSISQINENSKSGSRKRFVIPTLVITKVETLNFNEDDDDYDSS